MLSSLLALSLAVSPAGPPPFPWLGEDKFKHFFASFVVSSLAASGANAAGLSHPHSLAVGAGMGAAGGLFKEVHDQRAGGAFSGYDLLWDAAGVGSAILVLDAGH